MEHRDATGQRQDRR